MTQIKLVSREELDKKAREKGQPTEMARALRAYQFFPYPDSPTLGLLRFDTDAQQHWFLVTRKTLDLMSEEMAKCAQQLERLAS